MANKFEHRNFLQGAEFAKWRRLCGDEVIEVAGNHMVIKDAKRGRHAEIAGAVIKDVKSFAQAIDEAAKSANCVFVRVRPQLIANDENLTTMREAGFKPSPRHLYAENTVIMDLGHSEEELLAAMRKQTRYEIRHLDRHPNLIVDCIKSSDSASAQAWEDFAKMQAETAERQGFIPPSRQELLHLREAFGDQALLYRAKVDNQVLAYAIILLGLGEADYFEAASAEQARNIPVAYAIQWQIIRDLKALGLKYYNLFGIAPEGEPNHRYAKLTTFKRGFGEVVHYVPAQDLSIRGLKYQLLKWYSLYEKRKRGW
ncbi:peptidoglycan bridge formation glycyltransferase FemA/FemB family protein [Candidatus Saccharibacteria bacterium]|nr:peptidoglycan bridge formation glycyltransferase FemA/FemB family protein [Candidatus Saccharibacteria bacterium]